jgi:amidase
VCEYDTLRHRGNEAAQKWFSVTSVSRCVVTFVFFVLFVVQSQGPAAQHLPLLDVVDLSVADAQRRMTAGTLTSQALTRAYLDRIAAIDDSGPRLNAVIDINPAALKEAESRDAERRAGKGRGPLQGIPVLVKDNIDVAGMVNSAGSLAFADNRPKTDAFLIGRLRAAGVVILGRTNLSEWANFRSTASTSGWSSRGGQTKNAHVLYHNPCGSSSGSAVAAAASLAPVAIGTETNGSIICPASVNGVVGLKPTVGLVSRSGIIPIAATQDTAGPIGRTVADVAALLGPMAGVDSRDPATRASKASADYTRFLDRDALSGRRIGVFRTPALPADVDAAMTAALAAMQKAGATIVDLQLAGASGSDQLEVLLYEFKDGLNKYLATATSTQKSLAGLIAWNQANAARAMPLFGQELFESAQRKGPLTDKAYVDALASIRRRVGPEGLLGAIERERLAAVVTLSTGPAWRADAPRGDRGGLIGGYGAAAIAGTPSITIPIGDTRGLPFGLTFMGPPFSEPQLLALAYALEQRTNARRTPRFLPTLP